MDAQQTGTDRSSGAAPLRRGDSGLGRRLPDTQAEMPGSEWTPEPPEPLQLDDICVSRSVRSIAWLGSPVLRLVGAAVVALVLLYMLAMVGSAASSARGVGAPFGQIYLAGVVLLCGIVLFACARLTRLLRRLSRGPALDWQQVRLVADGPAGYEVYATAKEAVLLPYLRGYRKHIERSRDALARIPGWDEARVDGLLVTIDELLADVGRSSDEWIGELRERVLAPALASARKVVARKSRYVGLKTAVSPWPLVDVAAVLYHSIDMVRIVGLLLGRSVSRERAFSLVVQLAVNLYVAGEAQEVVSALGSGTEGASAAAADGTAGGLETLFGDLGAQSLHVLKAVGRKAAEGAANALLVRRLGRRAIDYMQLIAE